MQLLTSVTSWIFQVDFLNRLAIAMGVWDAPNIHLYQSPMTPQETDTKALYDAVAANYTGYAPQAGGTWIPAGLNSNSQVCIQQPTLQFTASGTALTNTIFGAYITDAADTDLLFVVPFATPVVMGVNVLEAINLDAAYTWGMTLPFTAAIAALAAQATMGGPLNGAKMKLWQGAFSPSPEMLLAGITEADYTGYAAKTLAAYLAAGVDTNDTVILQSATQQFAASGTALANTIGGVYITDSGATKLYLAQPLESSAVMAADQLHVLNASPILTMGT